MKKGHVHSFDIVEKIEVYGAKPVPDETTPLPLPNDFFLWRTIRIRMCACGEPGYEVPA